MYQVYEASRLPGLSSGGSRDLFSQQGSVSDPGLLDFEGFLKTGRPEEMRFCCSTDSSSQATLNAECPGKQCRKGRKITHSTELY